MTDDGCVSPGEDTLGFAMDTNFIHWDQWEIIYIFFPSSQILNILTFRVFSGQSHFDYSHIAQSTLVSDHSFQVSLSSSDSRSKVISVRQPTCSFSGYLQYHVCTHMYIYIYIYI